LNKVALLLLENGCETLSKSLSPLYNESQSVTMQRKNRGSVRACVRACILE